MKALTVVALWMTMALAFAGGFGARSAFAQQSSGAGQGARKLPPDVHPESLSRMPWATRDELSTDEEKQAFDRVVAAEPRMISGKGPLGGTATRLHTPVVAENYRNAYSWLRERSGLEPRYFELAVLIATRENDEEYEWVGHEKSSEKVLPRETLEVVRNKKDTKGLEEKDATLIQFGRELYHQRKVSSKTFADMERLFGRKGTLVITLVMGYYTSNALIMHAYDQHQDESRLGPGTKTPFPDLAASESKKR
jgi:4-carboxymuconolactone decarboxylase